MAYGLNSTDPTVTIFDGGIGVVPAYSSSLDITLLVKSFSAPEKTGTVDNRGFGDAGKRLRRTGDSGYTVSMELKVENTGMVRVPRGHFMKVIYQPGDGNSFTYSGIVTETTPASQLDQAQTISYTLEGPADGE